MNVTTAFVGDQTPPNPLAFSTLGCPNWNLDQILTAALDYGYDAVELRGYLNEMDLPNAEPFTPGNRTETRQRFADAGIGICCVASSGVVAQKNLDHVRAHAELAGDLGCPLVRVFGGGLPDDIAHGEAVDRAVETLRSFGDAARDAGVRIVLETHDAFSTGAQVAELIAITNHPSVGSLWDLHHPYRQGESPEETYRYLAPTVLHTHVKDSRPGDGYVLFGEGDVPMKPMLDLLLAGGYHGAITLEWEKRWHPTIAEPEIAFPQYAQALRDYLDLQRV
jgi:sugar phosphate isomerase/epimerase